MFKNHRIEVIKRIIEEKKYVEVSALSEILNVTEVTIRRDLNKLEESGFITRSFGGATLNEPAAGTDRRSVPDTGCSEVRSGTGSPQSPAYLIGQIALQHISDQDFIYIGPGEESGLLASSLASSGKSLSVVTNDIQIAQTLSQSRSIDTLLTGGMISSNSNILKGELLLHTLERLVVKKAFISVDGISLDKGFSANSYDMQSNIRFFNNSSCKLFIMFSSQKAGHNAPYILGDYQLPLCLISDFDLPSEYTAYYFEHNIPLYTALT